ncbi:hypothetical protein Slip_0060 [Syntrophothermus lipocalidus DSM 12680]|uniref:Uncharacterized protein n=1 Tax=Syntrophothermus lipocalidus (strain DSM 12680 / TGB-C1) TaxID=643648 RepID=D7CIK2_SYNLT|nr:hypothetical protein Slip_0060 [Syntrophothermus lipocalidus DSM 12680]
MRINIRNRLWNGKSKFAVLFFDITFVDSDQVFEYTYNPILTINGGWDKIFLITTTKKVM